MKKTVLAFAGIVIMAGAATAASATISAGPTINGRATFVDDNTGRQWLKTNTFFNKTPTAMINAANNAGFVLASRADVEDLLNSLPINAGQWAGIAAIMGKAPNRELVWGAFGPLSPGGNYGWAYAYDFNSAWGFDDDVAAAGDIQNGGTSSADMNIWAFYTSGGVGPGVPEPAAWAMLIAGFGLVGAMSRRRHTLAA